MDLRTIWVTDHASPTISLHGHNYYQMIYCQKGSGSITIGDSVYQAVPGSLYLIQPMVEHAIQPQDTFRLTEVKFIIRREDLDSSLRQLPTEIEIDKNTTLRLSMRDVIREGLADLAYSYEATNAALYLFLIRLLRNQGIDVQHKPWRRFYFDTPKRRSPGADGERDAEFAMLLDYIEHNLSECITLDSLAQQAHFDKSYLIARFKESTGTSPMRYVSHLRIERAKVLLATTDDSITQIAQAVGFSSIHYFSRFFKEKEGLAPVEYRQQRQNSVAASHQK
jgi:AraC-like DNA-binding protein